MIEEKTKEELKIKWGPLTNNPLETIKQVAKDIFNGLIYTDRHCQNTSVESAFMVLLFMGPQYPTEPQYPTDGANVAGNRDNALYDVLQREKDQAKFEIAKEEYEYAHIIFKEHLKSIGLIYEYLDKAGPMSVNGQPNFFSCRFMNKEDAATMWEYYEKYKAIREEADKL